MNKIKLFIDHDGTITHFDKTLRMWKYKDGLQEFLNFIIEYFDVYWCSFCEHEEIISELRNMGVEDRVLERIDYFEYDLSYEKAKSIIEITEEFIFIDDDSWDKERKFINRNGLQKNFIKAYSKDVKDLYRILEILKDKIL